METWMLPLSDNNLGSVDVDIIVPIWGNSRTDLLMRAKQCAGQADIVELRLDLCAPAVFCSDDTKEAGVSADSDINVAGLRNLFAQVSQAAQTRVLATIRTRSQGGESSLRGKQYLASVAQLADSGTWVDLEFVDLATPADIVNAQRPIVDCAKSANEGYLCAQAEAIWQAHARGATVIGSFHDFTGQVGAQELIARGQEMVATGVDIVKIALAVRTAKELDTLFQVSQSIQTNKIIIGMGQAGAVTRLFPQLFGSIATFATLAGQASAPGQFALAQVRRAQDLMRGAKREQSDLDWMPGIWDSAGKLVGVNIFETIDSNGI